MTRIFAIDPGPTSSGVVLYDDGNILWARISANPDLRGDLKHDVPGDLVAIEMIASYGMAVGAEVFATCVEIGRFVESARGIPTMLIPRKDIKLHLCGSARATDANIRQAILDLYGGKERAVGTKKATGPLYGIKSHMWAALAVAITAEAKVNCLVPGTA